MEEIITTAPESNSLEKEQLKIDAQKALTLYDVYCGAIREIISNFFINSDAKDQSVLLKVITKDPVISRYHLAIELASFHYRKRIIDMIEENLKQNKPINLETLQNKTISPKKIERILRKLLEMSDEEIIEGKKDDDIFSPESLRRSILKFEKHFQKKENSHS